MPEEKRNTLVYLMRAGDKDSNSPHAGLSEEGRKSVADLARFEFPRFNFDRVFIAPSNLARQTLEVLIKSAPDLVLISGDAIIQERPEIYSDHTKEWYAVLSAKKLEHMENLADFEAAEAAALSNGKAELQEGFILQEGERVFSFISQEEKKLRDQDVMFCIMHSPLPESVVLWLWKSKVTSIVARAKPLAEIRTLRCLDAYILFFCQSQIDRVTYVKNGEKIAEHLRKERLDKKFNNI